MNDMEHIDQETQQEPVAQVEQEAQEPQALTMEDIEKTVVRIRTGQTVTGTVVQITDDEVCVNIGYKSDGLIKRSDLVDQDVKLGDEIEVEVVKVNDGEGNVLLSQRNIVNRMAWDALMQKFENNEYIDAVGKEAVKGGLLASIEGGIRAFVPASQLAQRYVEKIDQFVGQPMKLKIIDVDKQKKRIVASRKQVIEEESAAKKAAAWDKLEEGAVVTDSVLMKAVKNETEIRNILGRAGIIHHHVRRFGRWRRGGPSHEDTFRSLRRGRYQRYPFSEACPRH